MAREYRRKPKPKVWDRELVERRIVLVMEARGMNRTELAEKLGIQKTNLSRYLTGRTVPSAARLLDICVVLGCSADYIVGLSNDPKIRF